MPSLSLCKLFIKNIYIYFGYINNGANFGLETEKKREGGRLEAGGVSHRRDDHDFATKGITGSPGDRQMQDGAIPGGGVRPRLLLKSNPEKYSHSLGKLSVSAFPEVSRTLLGTYRYHDDMAPRRRAVPSLMGETDT